MPPGLKEMKGGGRRVVLTWFCGGRGERKKRAKLVEVGRLLDNEIKSSFLSSRDELRSESVEVGDGLLRLSVALMAQIHVHCSI